MHPPFFAEEAWAVLNDVIRKMPAQPSALATVPADVEAVLAIGLAKQPDDRFIRASELADALADALAGQLADGTRQRARKLIDQHPWGARR